MTTLVGQPSSTGFTNGHALATNNRILYTQYVASATGTASNIYIWMQPNASTGKFKLAIWNASGTLIASTAEITPANGADAWLSATISASLVSGTTYYLGIMANGSAATTGTIYYYDNAADGGVGTNNNDAGTYPTVPNVAPGSDGNLVGKLPIYVDGTVSGAASKLLSKLQNQGGF